MNLSVPKPDPIDPAVLVDGAIYILGTAPHPMLGPDRPQQIVASFHFGDGARPPGFAALINSPAGAFDMWLACGHPAIASVMARLDLGEHDALTISSGTHQHIIPLDHFVAC